MSEGDCLEYLPAINMWSAEKLQWLGRCSCKWNNRHAGKCQFVRLAVIGCDGLPFGVKAQSEFKNRSIDQCTYMYVQKYEPARIDLTINHC